MNVPSEGVVVCRLGEVMEERGLSVSAVAREAGLSRRTVSNWRDNRTDSFGGRALARLCDALQVSPGRLLLHIPRSLWKSVKSSPQHAYRRYVQ